MRLAHFELHVTAVDPGEPRTRLTTGGPLASKAASKALERAADEFVETLRTHGFLVVRTGYGVTASEVDG